MFHGLFKEICSSLLKHNFLFSVVICSIPFVLIFVSLLTYNTFLRIVLNIFFIVYCIFIKMYIKSFRDDYQNGDIERKKKLKEEYIKLNNFALKTKTGFKLYNKNVILIYDENKDKILCCNLQDTSESFELEYVSEIENISLYKYEDYSRYQDINIIFLKVFKYTTTYHGILSFLQKHNIDILTNDSNKKCTKNIQPNNRKKNLEIDINNASEEEIAKIPGVTIVQAKKVIKYIQINNGFKTKEEFIKFLKPTQRLVQTIEDSVIIQEVHQNSCNDFDNETRIIDF